MIKFPLRFNDSKHSLERLNYYITNKYGDLSIDTYPLSFITVHTDYKPEGFKELLDRFSILYSDRTFLSQKKKNTITYEEFSDEYSSSSIIMFELSNQVYLEAVIYGTDVLNIGFIYKESKKNIDSINEILQLLVKYEVKQHSSSDSYIMALTSDGMSMSFQPEHINKPKFKVSDNYNDDIVEQYEYILKELKKPKGNGIVLLHGLHGTGKTIFIKFLVNAIKKKDFLYTESNLMHQIGTPQFMNLLKNHPNSILILEEADAILFEKESGMGNSDALSNLLSLTDGMTSDYTNIQIIATFNTEIKNIDNALKRKGRIIDMIEFTKLNKDKANALAQKLKLDVEYDKDVLLTDIYNHNSKDYKDKLKTIGFKK